MKGAHTGLFSSICQNSENVLHEKLMLLDKTGSVALLSVLDNSTKKRFCYQISIRRRKDTEFWTEQQMLWHVKDSIESLMGSYCEHSESGYLRHLGCARVRCSSAGLRPDFRHRNSVPSLHSGLFVILSLCSFHKYMLEISFSIRMRRAPKISQSFGFLFCR